MPPVSQLMGEMWICATKSVHQGYISVPVVYMWITEYSGVWGLSQRNVDEKLELTTLLRVYATFQPKDAFSFCGMKIPSDHCLDLLQRQTYWLDIM